MRRSPRSQSQARGSRRVGMTLIEVVVAIAMFSLIALALESALMLATKAIPDAKSVNASFMAAAKVHDQIAAELFYAQSVTEMTSTSISFTVADRDNDGAPETIRYAWSGTSGDPLRRQYNAAAAVNVLNDVREFALTFDKRVVKSPSTYTEGPEQQLYSSGKGLLGGNADIDTTNFVGEAFPTPNWPSTVAFWRITRLRVSAQRSGSSGDTFRVQVRKSDGSGLPTNAIVDQAAIRDTDLATSYSPYDVTFTGPPTLLPTDTACIVFRHTHSGVTINVWSNNLSLALLSGTQLVSSANAGASWSGNTLRAVAMTVWCAGSTKDPDTFQYYLSDVRALLRTGADPAARIDATYRIPAEPQVAGP